MDLTAVEDLIVVQGATAKLRYEFSFAEAHLTSVDGDVVVVPNASMFCADDCELRTINGGDIRVLDRTKFKAAREIIVRASGDLLVEGAKLSSLSTLSTSCDSVVGP